MLIFFVCLLEIFVSVNAEPRRNAKKREERDGFVVFPYMRKIAVLVLRDVELFCDKIFL